MASEARELRDRDTLGSDTGSPHQEKIVSFPVRFLSPGERKETIVLASYPRSGNSLLRSLMEKLTGIVTGSDTKPTRSLSKRLLDCGLQVKLQVLSP